MVDKNQLFPETDLRLNSSKSGSTDEAQSVQDIILHTVAVGSIYLLIGYIVSLSLGIFTKFLLSRWLGEYAFGQYSIIISLTTMTYILTMFAFDTSFLRYIPSTVPTNPEEVSRTIYSVTGVIGLTSGILAVIIFVFREFFSLLFLQSPLLATAITIGAVLIPSLALYTLLYSAFQAFQDMRSVMRITILQSVMMLGFTVIFLGVGWGINGALLAILGANIVTVLTGYLVLRRTLLVPVRNKRPSIPKSVVTLGGMVYVVNIFGVISSQSGPLLLGIFGLVISAGIFSICWMFGEIIFNMVSQVAYRAFFPLVSNLKASNSPKIEPIFNRVMRYTLLTALALYLPLLLIPEIILPIFGPVFIQGALAWRILVIGFLLRTLSQPPETFLVVEERRRFEIGLHGIGCGILLTLLFILIPILGLNGVATAIFFWQLTLFSCIWIYFSKTHKFSYTFLSPKLDAVDRAVLKGLFRKLIRKST